MTSIYALVDPRDGLHRYVGRSRNPKQRYGAHVAICSPWRRPENRRKDAWIRELHALGLRPLLVILESCAVMKAPAAEEKWIERYRPDLFNGRHAFLTKPVRLRRSGKYR